MGGLKTHNFVGAFVGGYVGGVGGYVGGQMHYRLIDYFISGRVPVSQANIL